MFTPDERARVFEALVEMARLDGRITSAAAVGGSASDRLDRWADIDLTLGVGGSVSEVLEDWTRRLAADHHAVYLFDLPWLTTIYRVFLFPGNLQVDLSFTKQDEFGALGPRFKLLFGTTVERQHNQAPSEQHLFGLAVHHAVRGRISIERGRVWQAEHWIDQVRELALSLACLRRTLPWNEGRGVDRLPADVLDGARVARATSLERDELLRALTLSIKLLVGEAPDLAAPLERALADLIDA